MLRIHYRDKYRAHPKDEYCFTDVCLSTGGGSTSAPRSLVKVLPQGRGYPLSLPKSLLGGGPPWPEPGWYPHPLARIIQGYPLTSPGQGLDRGTPSPSQDHDKGIPSPPLPQDRTCHRQDPVWAVYLLLMNMHCKMCCC